MNNDNDLFKYTKTQDVFSDTKNIINSAKEHAYTAINKTLIIRNWLLGKRISEEVLKKDDRAEYGIKIIKNLSKQLTETFGKGFNETNLYWFKQFYEVFPSIFHMPCGELENRLLSWSHYRTLLQVNDEEARLWYLKEAFSENWSVKTLQRNISSQYYFRLLKSQNKENVAHEMDELTKNEKYNKLEFIKNPVIAEFLGLEPNSDFTETVVEKAILSNLQKFIMELGKGYAFVARQQHIQTEKQDYFIDLVFYNYLLKCFVLIDLKTTKISHQDVGQMDMYVRMYDEIKKSDDDNPTIGIILCSDTDEDIARYSILKENEYLFASKYKLYLPSEDELRAEIDRQKMIFKLQNEPTVAKNARVATEVIKDEI